MTFTIRTELPQHHHHLYLHNQSCHNITTTAPTIKPPSPQLETLASHLVVCFFVIIITLLNGYLLLDCMHGW